VTQWEGGLTLWAFIPMLIIGYVLIGFLTGLGLVLCNWQTTWKANKEDNFDLFTICSVLWPVALPVSVVVLIIMSVGRMAVGYSEFLKVTHGKVHAERNRKDREVADWRD
jgi:hypothetical protein